MPRQSLPDLYSEFGGSRLFPTFQREMNRLFDQFRSGLPLPEASEAGMFDGEVFPAIDVVSSDDAVEVSAEVPGVQEKDLEAFIYGDLLVLKGTKSSDHEEKDDNFHRIERRYGSFKRQIPLGFTPEDDAIESSFGDGVLKLRIAKPATAKADMRKIDIGKG